MKRIVLTFMIITAVMTFNLSCSDEEISPILTVKPLATEIIFSADGGTSIIADGSNITPTFTVVTNQDLWDVSVSPLPTWVRVSKLSNGFLLSADPITGTIAPKPAEVIVTAGNAKPVTIVVRQLLLPPTLMVSPLIRSIEFSGDGTTTQAGSSLITPEFNVFTSMGIWDVQSDKDWLTVHKEDKSFSLSAATLIGSVVPHEPATVTVSVAGVPDVTIAVTQRDYYTSNVAYRKPAVASDVFSTYAASKAVDGDKTSDAGRWVSILGASVERWLEVDLQGDYTIFAFGLWRDMRNPPQIMPYFDLQAWINDTWVTVFSEENNTTDSAYYKEFEEVTTNKVRWYLAPPSAGENPNLNNVRLYELEVLAKIKYVE